MIGSSTAAFYDRAGSDLGRLRRQAERLQGQIATGDRLHRPSDDPIAAARLRTLSRQHAFAGIDRQAADRATIQLSNTASTLGELASTVIRARELAMQGATSTASAETRRIIGNEMAALFKTTLAFANSGDGQGAALFGGTAPAPAYAPSATGATYQGAAEPPMLDLGDGQNVRAGLIGPEVFALDPETSGGSPDLFAALRSLADALQSGDAANLPLVQKGISALDQGLERITAAQTHAGARLTHVETVTNVQNARADTRLEEQSRIGGADLAATISELQQTMTVLEASQASFVRLSGLSLFEMLR